MATIAEVVVNALGKRLNGYLPSYNAQQYGNTPNYPLNEFNQIKTSLFKEVERAGLDTTTLTSDIQHLLPEVLNAGIITIAEDLRIARSLVNVIPMNSDSQSFLKEYGFRAQWVPERAEIPRGKVRYDKEVITVQKFGISIDLTYEAIADAKISILQRNIRQAILAMARFEDAHIMDVLLKNVPNGTTIKGINENSHIFTSTATTTIAWQDIVRAYTSIEREGLTPTDMVLHPYQYAQLLTLQEFRDMTAGHFVIFPSRAERAVASGIVDQLLGMQMHVTNNMTAGKILIVDKNNYGVLGERSPLLTENDRDIIRQTQQVAFSQRELASVLNENGAAMVDGLATTLAGITV